MSELKHQHWTRVETLFHSAMEKPNARREAFLKDVAENDNEYDEALKLVKAAEMSADFMSTSIELEDFSPSLVKGHELGVWRVGEVLGSGGMGEVYKVSRHSDKFEQTGALKIARTRDAEYLKRFEQERRILARLEHPNIGRLIDGGQSEDGNPFMVVEYISGEPLTEYSDRHNLNASKRLDLFSNLCKAVTHAHGRLVLHRDIKPANIMVGDDSQVKLIDFGVADTLQDDGQSSNIGPITRAYAAPEQLEGKAVSAQTDVYALGCVLHELLSGERLSPSFVADAKLPEDLRAIIAKATKPLVADRYDSVAELNQDIENFRNIQPVTAHMGGRGYRLRKFFTRNKFASIATGLFFAAIGAGFAGTYSQMRQAQIASQAAQTAALEQEFEARTAAGFRYGLQTLYGGSEDTGDKIDPAVLDKSMLTLSEPAKLDFDGTDLDQAFLLYSMAQHFMNRYDFARGAELLEPLLQINPTQTELLEALYIESKSDLARCYSEIGKKEKAVHLLTELNAERHKFDGYLYDLGHVQDQGSLASITREQADQNEQIRVIKETLALYLKDDGNESDISYLYNQWGMALLGQGKLLAAIEPFEKNFKLRDGDRISSPERLTAATNLAQFQIYFGNEGWDALEYLPRYLPFAIDEFGDELRHGFTQTLITNAALVEKDWLTAEQASRDGLDKLSQDKEYRDGLYFSLISLRTQALSQLGRFDEAKSLIEDGLKDIEKTSIKREFPSVACTLNVTNKFMGVIQEPTAPGLEAFDQVSTECQAHVADRASSQLKYENLIKNMRKEIELVLG